MGTASLKTLKFVCLTGLLLIFGASTAFLLHSQAAASTNSNALPKRPTFQQTVFIQNLFHPVDLFKFANEQLTEKTTQRSNKAKVVGSDEDGKIQKAEAFDKLIADADKGKVRVIVGLDVDFVPEGNLAQDDLAETQRGDIRTAQKTLLNKLSWFNVGKIKQFEFIPFLAMEVDADALRLMKDAPEVTFIQEDEFEPATLAESTRMIGANASWTAGLTGSGWTIAVLDSGVDKNHPFLQGKVVSEACYSTAGTSTTGATLTSTCPGGVSESTAVGSGVNCSASVAGCDHGTYVAGIAAGRNDSTGVHGVAKDANLIAIQVHTYQSTGGTGSSASDQIKALERVYALRNTYNIAAVNMSLGGGRYTSICDSVQTPRKAAIDNLRSVNIATITTTGNDSYTDSLIAPGCISTSVSVGSVRDGAPDSGGAADTVSNFSNSASFFSLLAPGEKITSATLGGGYASYGGTSAAAPHVAGAWAILKQRMGGAATVQQILDRLNNTGVSVTDARNGVTKNRIKIDTAVYVGCNASLPNASAGIGSSGGNGSFNLTIDSGCGWNAISNASWITTSSGSAGGSGTITYTVAANNSSGSRTGTISVAGQTFTITQSGVSCGATLTPNSASVNDFGGTGSFNVSRSSACQSWTAGSTVSWITVTSGGGGTTGNGTVTYSVAANTGTAPRSGSILISAGVSFTITQDGAPACVYTLGSNGRFVDADSDSFSFSVSPNRNHCSWSASVTSGNSWLSIASGSNGTGNGSVNFSVTANSSSTTARVGTISVAGQTYTVSQSAANLPCSPVTSDLIGWYRGENNVSDLIGANNGTMTGSISYAAGKSGQAMSFDGNDAATIQRPIGDDFSIEFWIKTTSAGGSGETNWYTGVGLVDAEVSQITNDFGVSLGNGKILFGVGNPDTTIRSANTINDNQWHHVVATRRKSSGAIALYIDGVLSSSGTGGTQTFNAPSQISIGKLQTGGFYVGQLDEIKIYEDDLSASQATSAFNGCAGAQPSVSIADNSLNEGNNGMTNASFTVSLSAAAAQNVSVSYATQDVTATAGNDYTATSGTLTIFAGQTSGTINVPVFGDTLVESNETFKVVLSNASGTAIADSEAVGTIVNDDQTTCSYSLSPTSQVVPAAGGSSFSISVTTTQSCQWTATENADWLSITQGASGTESGTVFYSVQSNPNSTWRSTAINIGGQSFTVMQEGSTANCTYSLSTDSQIFTSSGGSAIVDVTAPAGCAWSVSNPLSWVSISNSTGSGNGSVTITVPSNPSTSARYGFITIAGIQLFVGQEAIPTYYISGVVTYGTTPVGQATKYVSGAKMSLTGAAAQDINSTSTGGYSFMNLLTGNYTVTPTKTTQINGINAFDAAVVLRCVAAGNNCTLTANQRKAADCDNNGSIDAFDAAQILRFVAANGSNANTGRTGKWIFVQPLLNYTPLSSSYSNGNYAAFLIGEVNGDWSPTAP